MRRLLTHHWQRVVVTGILLGVPSVAYAQESHLTDGLLAAYVITGFTDATQTAYCLGAGTCREVNPVMRWAIARSNVPTAMTAKGLWHVGLAIGLHNARRQHPKAVRWIAAIATGAQLAIVVHNAKVLR